MQIKLHSYILVLAVFLPLSFAGCTSNTTVVANTQNNNNLLNAGAKQGQPNARQIQELTARPCFLPADQKGAYATAVPVSSLTVKPERADKEHMNGCVSAKFTLDETGKASAVSILAENPQGYGFGEALTKSIQGSTYKPPVSSQQLYYVMTVWVYNSAAH